MITISSSKYITMLVVLRAEVFNMNTARAVKAAAHLVLAAIKKSIYPDKVAPYTFSEFEALHIKQFENTLATKISYFDFPLVFILVS